MSDGAAAGDRIVAVWQHPCTVHAATRVPMRRIHLVLRLSSMGREGYTR